MFSFRKKPKVQPEEPRIRGSPSLPELHSQGIPWPESLLDVSSIEQEPITPTHQGAAKTSFQGVDRAPILFHKPFRLSSGKRPEGQTISSLYMSNTANLEENWRTAPPKSASRYSQRRARVPPTFNLMVVGSQGTGKTSLLRLLLDTADISPTATVDQRAAVDRFLRGQPKTTQSISTACVEICESRFDRVLLSVIDTPGLDYVEGRELKLERQVSSIMKYVDAQYADTMSEESKVVRKNKGDQHIHLCIYMVDPASIMSVSSRRALSTLPAKTRSDTTVSHKNPPDLVPDTSSGDDSDEEEETLTMSPAELRVIRRLSTRMNILPVIARADSLTDEKLAAVKEVVRNGIYEAGLDFGVFASRPRKRSESATPKRKTKFSEPREAQNEDGVNGINGTTDSEVHAENPEEGPDDEERQSRPVIKLRSSRHSSGRNLSRSRSRRDLSQAAEDHRRPVSPDATDNESVANVRFSAHIVAKADLSNDLPFAVIAPEMTKKRQHRHRSSDSAALSTAPSSPLQQSEDGHSVVHDRSGMETPVSAVSGRNLLPYLSGPPDDLKGMFVRKFRWGTIDVLDPNHCDFSALRTAVLSTHITVLKTHTKEVLYEKYRTEKLLARRATRQITEEDKQRLLEDLGL